MGLEQLRAQLDELDEKIVALYEERMAISELVAEDKIQTGKKVFDPAREQEKIRTLRALAHNEFNRQGIGELYGQIMSISRKLQYQKLSEAGALGKLPFYPIDAIDKEHVRVCYQGAEGAYSQEATNSFFGEGVKSFAVDTFRDAMIAIEEGSADFAVLPIENSTAGVVTEIYDLLSEYENYIIAEQIIPIRHCLIGLPDAREEEIRTVFAHPQALMQSAQFLAAHPKWQQISLKNNAFAVKRVKSDGDPTQAAIAGELAAGIYGMKILRRGIQSARSNSTRFIIVTNQKVFLKDAKRVSICFEIRHEAGSLYHLMSHIIYNNLNMTKIESRPMEERDWEYRFFIDFEGNLLDSAVKNALRGLREEALNLRILGNY
ncbi:MAG: prephenate dehydratase [Lachnospiraceae bacterium]|nr:prephenate dehydratase [Lachnospiraceae bacterium]